MQVERRKVITALGGSLVVQGMDSEALEGEGGGLKER